MRGVSRDAGAVRELDAAGMVGFVAPLAARAITVHVAATRRLAQKIRAARAGAADGSRVGGRARAVIGRVAARAVRIAHAGTADRCLVGDRAGAATVQLAALVVDHIAHAGLADQASGWQRARAVQHRARMRRIRGNARAIAELCATGVIRLVAPLAARTVGVHVAAVERAAEQIAAAAPRAANRTGVGSRARAAVDVVTALVVRVAHSSLADERCSGSTAVAIQDRARVRGIGRNAAAVRQLGRALLSGLVAPLAAGAVGIDVATADGLAQQVGAAQARTADRSRVARGARPVIGSITARTIRVAHGGAANGRLVGHRACAAAVQLAAIVVHVTDRALTD